MNIYTPNGQVSVKVIRDSSLELVFQIDHFSEVNNELLDKLFDQHPGKQMVFRTRQTTIESLEDLKKVDMQKYFIQLGFTANNEHLKTIPYNDNCNPKNIINITESGQKEDLNKIIMHTFEEYFDKKWYPYLGKKFSNDWIGYLRSMLDSSRNYGIKCNNQISGLLVLSSSKDCLQNSLMQIEWIWVDQEKDIDTRKQIHRKIVDILKNAHPGTYQAGVHLYNTVSQKFFSKIGFQLKCAHILKK